MSRRILEWKGAPLWVRHLYIAGFRRLQLLAYASAYGLRFR